MKENNNGGPKRTKLHEAAENGNLSSFQSIIENMLSVEIVNTEDFNPKGQKISEGNCGVFNSPKKTNFFPCILTVFESKNEDIKLNNL